VIEGANGVHLNPLVIRQRAACGRVTERGRAEHRDDPSVARVRAALADRAHPAVDLERGVEPYGPSRDAGTPAGRLKAHELRDKMLISKQLC